MPRVHRSSSRLAGALCVLIAGSISFRANAMADERSSTRPAPRPPAPTPATPRQNPTETPPLAADAPKAAGPAEEIPLAGGDFQMIHTPSSPEAFGGARTGTEATLSDRVADYKIQVKLNPVAHTLEGKETLRWHNRSALPVRTLYFHTYLNAFSGPGSTFLHEKDQYGSFRSGVELKKGEWGSIDVLSVEQDHKAATLSYVHPDGGPSTNRTVLRVELKEPVAPGATVELQIAFHDQLPRVMARTGWFGSFHLVGQFFPKIGVLKLAGERGALGPRWNCHELHLNTEFYADWGSFELEVTAPKGFTVEGNGVRVGTAQETPAGVVHTFKAEDMHDTVFTAWDGFAPPLHGTYDGPGSPHVDVDVYFPPEYAESGKLTLQATLDSLKFFSEQLGPYPYKHVTAVLPPFNAAESGGMEYETFFTSEANTLPAAVRFVTVHEFGHGYFMGLLASNEFEEPFLDEGLNELYDTRMLHGDPQHEKMTIERVLGLELPPIDPFHVERAAAIPQTQADPLADSAWHRYSGRSYNSVYVRTTTVFHDLEQEIGTPVFEKAFHLYYERFKFRHPSAADLQKSLLDAGANPEVIERVFSQMVYGTGLVDDAIEALDSAEDEPKPGLVFENGKWVELDPEAVEKQITEKREAFKKEHADAKDEEGKHHKGPKGPFAWRSAVKAIRRGAWVPQTLLVTFEDGKTERIAWPANEKWHRWEFLRPSRIESAQLDPDGAILIDVNKFDDGKAREPSHAATRRWELELGALLEAVLTLGGSL